MSGLLDCIADPGFWKHIEERRALVKRLADWAGTTPALAEQWLDAQDCAAVEWFAIGNDIPREALH